MVDDFIYLAPITISHLQNIHFTQVIKLGNGFLEFKPLVNGRILIKMLRVQLEDRLEDICHGGLHESHKNKVAVSELGMEFALGRHDLTRL